MHRLLFAAIIAGGGITPATDVRAEDTRKVCASFQDNVNKAAELVGRYSAAVDALDFRGLTRFENPAVDTAARRAQAAAEKAAPIMREYTQALEDLGYQLRVCAR